MKNEIEIWKQVKGYEGIYEISSFGRVKSLERLRVNKVMPERMLRPRISKGYGSVSLNKDKKVKTHTIHQLVAVAFLNHVPCKHKWVVNHKDFNKSNNNVSNLEIITARENANLKHIPHSSIYTGVHYSQRDKSYKATINIGNKKIYLGSSKIEYEAHLMYSNYVEANNLLRSFESSAHPHN